MADVIKIRGLRVAAHIGVTDDERARPQTLVIDVEIESDLATAARSDRLTDTIDYDLAIGEVARFVEKSRSHLLEHLADQVARLLLERHEVHRVAVQIAKAKPPVEEDVDMIAVRIERSTP